jgi:hypothetical protein
MRAQVGTVCGSGECVGRVGMWVYRGIDMLPRWCADMLICGHLDVSACIGAGALACRGVHVWGRQLMGMSAR